MTDHDPYAPPAESDEPPPALERLYAPWVVMLCGILFGPLVGCGVAATNYARMGERTKAQQMWAVGIGCCLVLAAIVVFLSDSPTLLRGAGIGGTAGLASSLRLDQKRLVEAHVAAGGELDSPVVPLVAGVAFVAAVVGAIFVVG